MFRVTSIAYQPLRPILLGENRELNTKTVIKLAPVSASIRSKLGHLLYNLCVNHGSPGMFMSHQCAQRAPGHSQSVDEAQGKAQ